MENTGTKTIKTKRLLLRKMRLCDYFAFYQWFRLIEVSRFSQRTKDVSRREAFDFLLRRVYNYYYKRRSVYYAWAIELDGKMVGFVMMNDVKKDVFSIYYMLSPEYQHQGYMKEAVSAVMEYMKTQSCRAVLGGCDSQNIASYSVLQTCGFSYRETEENAYHYRDGSTGDKEIFIYILKPKNNA